MARPRPWRSPTLDLIDNMMHEAVLIKFLTHIDIQSILISTGDRLIVENSPTDCYWGCGGDKTGQNHLGKILMNVRQEIRQRLALMSE